MHKPQQAWDTARVNFSADHLSGRTQNPFELEISNCPGILAVKITSKPSMTLQAQLQDLLLPYTPKLFAFTARESRHPQSSARAAGGI